MEGEKKYSPPREITHSFGRLTFPGLSLVLKISISRTPPPPACPIIASMPGPFLVVNPGFGTGILFASSLRNGKVALFAQPETPGLAKYNRERWRRNIHTLLDKLEPIRNVALITLEQ
jgi:hypothetical protein